MAGGAPRGVIGSPSPQTAAREAPVARRTGTRRPVDPPARARPFSTGTNEHQEVHLTWGFTRSASQLATVNSHNGSSVRTVVRRLVGRRATSDCPRLPNHRPFAADQLERRLTDDLPCWSPGQAAVCAFAPPAELPPRTSAFAGSAHHYRWCQHMAATGLATCWASRGGTELPT